MTSFDHWQLPDGVEEVLPGQADVLESLRRDVLNLYRSWGYQLVIPPLVEFAESLLVGLGEDLDLHTFKVTDQLSGRTLGIRADITPQVARIDAHSLAQAGISRLCYAGATLHARPRTLFASRSPIQLGAELYGDDSAGADVEIVRLMMATLNLAGLSDITLDLGHVGVYEAVLKAANLDADLERTVFDALQRKSIPDLRAALAGVDGPMAEQIIALADLHGDDAVLLRARDIFASTAPDALAAIDTLAELAADLRLLQPNLTIYFDLAELRGYHYHTGLVFAAYVPGHGEALANGGRYNNVGQVFGRARPATGFATDLKALSLLAARPEPEHNAISAPDVHDPLLLEAVQGLRAQGEIVISALAGVPDPRCTRQLVESNGAWHVVSIDT
jgi:ATP phosphoribosyltransferase regulatory subunit